MKSLQTINLYMQIIFEERSTCLRMEAVNKIQEDLTFDEMQEWIQSKEDEYREAVGEDVYDGFAFTYKRRICT